MQSKARQGTTPPVAAQHPKFYRRYHLAHVNGSVGQKDIKLSPPVVARKEC